MTDITGFQCTSCGKCCLEGAGTLQALEADIAMWEEHAPHLLKFVTIHGPAGQRTGDLWPGPIGSTSMGRRSSTRCRWVKKYPGREAWYCRIYKWRPQVCQRYPTSLEHARFTDCPGVDDIEV